MDVRLRQQDHPDLGPTNSIFAEYIFHPNTDGTNNSIALNVADNCAEHPAGFLRSNHIKAAPDHLSPA
jgi:ubiquitin-protein ligase